MMFRAELHVHTDISDGSRTAEQILKEAGKKGLTHIAFTDHDTTLKSREHTELARKYGIRAVPAVELSAYDRSAGRKVHILGYHYKTAEHIEAIGGRTLKKRDENCKSRCGFWRDSDMMYRLHRSGKFQAEGVFINSISFIGSISPGSSRRSLGRCTGKSLRTGVPVISILHTLRLRKRYRQ